jgi:hypothetical protein
MLNILIPENFQLANSQRDITSLHVAAAPQAPHHEGSLIL